MAQRWGKMRNVVLEPMMKVFNNKESRDIKVWPPKIKAVVSERAHARSVLSVILSGLAALSEISLRRGRRREVDRF